MQRRQIPPTSRRKANPIRERPIQPLIRHLIQMYLRTVIRRILHLKAHKDAVFGTEIACLGLPQAGGMDWNSPGMPGRECSRVNYPLEYSH